MLQIKTWPESARRRFLAAWNLNRFRYATADGYAADVDCGCGWYMDLEASEEIKSIARGECA